MTTDLKQRILETCHRLFMRYGLRAVTMNQIATELGISKKTIYQYVPDKTTLVREVIQLHMRRENEVAREFHGASANPVEELFLIFKYVNHQLSEMHPGLMIEVRRHFPDSYTEIQRFKQDFILVKILENLKRGYREGLYREDIDPEIMARYYLSIIDSVLDTELFPADVFSQRRVHHHIITHFLRGICSPAGLELLNTYENDQDDTPL